MLKSIPAARAVALAALLFSAACTDRSPTEAGPAPLPGEEVRAEIACTVTVATARLTCGVPSPLGGASATVMLGGQGTYVRLESTNLAYDADADLFSVDVSVQNLLGQLMGTPDGATATGMRVFFEQMPVATEGSGQVTVANADGVASYTAVQQPYFEYPEILEPLGTSAPRTWRFGVPGTVTRFGFKVYVITRLQVEQGVLRWQFEGGSTTRESRSFGAVWGASRDYVFAVAGRAILQFQRHPHDPTLHYWSPIAEAPVTLIALWGTSRFDMYAAGDSGVVMGYDGNRWTVRRASSTADQLLGLWSGGGDVWAVGRRQADPAGDADGLLLHSGDAGESWTETVSPGGGKRYLRDVFAAGSHVYAVGYQDPLVAGAAPRAGVLLRSDDGGATWADSLFSGLGAATLHTVWADGPLDVWIGGETTAPGMARQTFLLHTTDGGATWTTASSHQGNVRAMYRIPGGDLLAVGGNSILANDGTGWRQLEQSCLGIGATWLGVWASSLDDMFFHVSGLMILRNQEGCLRMTYAGLDNYMSRLSAVHMGPDVGYIAGTMSTTQDGAPYNAAAVLGTSGAGWSINYNGPNNSAFEDVWVLDMYNPIAVGWWDVEGGRRGFIMRRHNNSFWQDVSPVLARDVPLTAVWRSGSEVYTFGVRAGSPASIVVLRSLDSGATWIETAAIPWTGAGTPQVTEAWGSSPSAIHVTGYAEGDGGVVQGFTLRYDGTSWTLSAAPGDDARLTAVWSSGAYAVMSGYRAIPGGWAGFVRTSTDGGVSWTEMAIPTAAENGRIEGVWGTSPTSLYAAGNGGRVYHYDGTRWSTMMGLGGADLYAIGGRSAGDVVAVGLRGIIYHGTR